mmetsp:Transcript_25449/g.43507  ORF Transcript_25449/g.43507 Transcript_25449/m.43507 type:complete len:101 (+) Transcript_25449:30-332(+)
MPQAQQNTTQYYQVAPRPSILNAWGNAISETCTYLSRSEHFVPIAVALTAGVLCFKETDGHFVSYFLITGTAGVIAKLLPSSIIPICGSFLLFKCFKKND